MMGNKFTKQKINPLELIKTITENTVPHITYDPTLRGSNCDYKIIRSQTSDGTLIFTQDLLLKTLIPVVNKNSYSKLLPPAPDRVVVDVKYTVGPLWLSTVFGTVDLPVGHYPGQRERTRMPVKVEYIYAE